MFTRLFSRQKSKPANPQVTTEELATLAYDVYHYSDRPGLPSGWVDYLSFEKEADDYYGSLYVKFAPQPVAFVLAHRGTVPSKLDNILNDLEIMLEKLPRHIKYATEFMNMIGKKISSDERFNGYIDKLPMYFTGHSSGAIISDLTYSTFLYLILNDDGSINNRFKSITFENPGSFSIVQNYLRKILGIENSSELLEILLRLGNNVSCFQADINVVNSCNQQWGKVFKTIEPTYNYHPLPTSLPSHPSPICEPNLDISKDYRLNPYYVVSYSFIDQHSMLGLLNYITSNKPFELTSAYPSGFANGYNAYLNPDVRFKYWSGYFSWCWEHSEKIRLQYNNDKDLYLLEMFDLLSSIHKNQHEVKSQPAFTFFRESNHKIIPISQDNIVHDFILIEKESDSEKESLKL